MFLIIIQNNRSSPESCCDFIFSISLGSTANDDVVFDFGEVVQIFKHSFVAKAEPKLPSSGPSLKRAL